MKIKLSIVEDEDITPTHFGFMIFVQVEPYANLYVDLESNGVLDWPFDFWDKEDIYPAEHIATRCG